MHFSDPFKVAPEPRHNHDYREARKVFCQGTHGGYQKALIPINLELINNEELIEKLKDEHYDVYLTTPYDYCGLGLHYVLGNIPSVSAYTATQVYS
jgi:hypothetical protein